jgi:hypothetical protein
MFQDADVDEGCCDDFKNDFQAAYHVSLLRRDGGDRYKIADMVDAGMFCVVAHVPDFCPLTDAQMPDRVVLVDFATTRAEAEEKAYALGEDDEVHYCVEPVLSEPRKVLAEVGMLDDLPF